tara:strand:- start:201 stop:497 length:297 start_codon:yes stop_codon:yes gene_type:complete
MQSDIVATKPLTSTGLFKTQADANCTFRVRIMGIYAVCGSSAGSVVIADGSGGDTLLTMNTPASGGGVDLILPGQGILASSGLHGTVTNTTSITLFYG